ncbi:MAG: hypothetical protein K2M56_07315 [Muribaculaceae bacterium]|nr:hypothetical protein [Muribaculaceae bacterium]
MAIPRSKANVGIALIILFVLIPAVFVEGDINKTDGCVEAAALANRF